MEKIGLKCGTLSNIKKRRGGETYCIGSILHIRNIRIPLTYDCNDNNLVIHNWYKLMPDEIKMITNEVSKYFDTIK